MSGSKSSHSAAACDETYWAIVPAAGVGKRMQTQIPKQYLTIHNRTVLEHTLQRLLSHPKIQGVVVALSDDDAYWAQQRMDGAKPVLRASGGAERCQSVKNALDVLLARNYAGQWVLVHDAARPCLRHSDIDALIRELSSHSVGGLLGYPVRDTMKLTDSRNEITATVDRSGLWHALTPQMFRVKELRDAIQQALDRGVIVTDEAAAMEYLGHKPKLVLGQADNIKITRPEDLQLATFYLAQMNATETHSKEPVQ